MRERRLRCGLAAREEDPVRGRVGVKTIPVLARSTAPRRPAQLRMLVLPQTFRGGVVHQECRKRV